MTTTIENEVSNPFHGFFLIIPAFISNDPDIDDSTAMLYGRIVALSNVKGHCWASDKYLAELTRVSDREVRRRLVKLEEKGYIKKEAYKDGFVWRRKIYPVFNEKISTKGPGGPLEAEQVVLSNRTTASEEQDKHNNISNTNKQADRIFEGLDLTEDDKKFLKKYDIVLLAEAISVCQTIEIKTTFAQALKWLIQKPKSEWPKPKPTTNDQITWAQQAIKEVESIIPKQFKVEFLTYGVEIVAAAWCLVIEYKDLRFKEKLTEWIQKVKNQ